MKMKKLIGIVLAAACMVSLAGCGSSEKKEVNVEKPEDLKTLTIGVQQGTTGDIYCSDTPEKGGYGEDHVVAYQNGASAVQALKTGKVDAVVIDNEPAKAFVEANEGLKILDTAYTTEDYAAAVSKDNPALTAALNKALQELKDDGTIQGILDKYIKAE